MLDGFQYIHVTINQFKDILNIFLYWFQYIHVTINQHLQFLSFYAATRFNTSMLLLIREKELLKEEWYGVSIHPCYY